MAENETALQEPTFDDLKTELDTYVHAKFGELDTEITKIRTQLRTDEARQNELKAANSYALADIKEQEALDNEAAQLRNALERANTARRGLMNQVSAELNAKLTTAKQTAEKRITDYGKQKYTTAIDQKAAEMLALIAEQGEYRYRVSEAVAILGHSYDSYTENKNLWATYYGANAVAANLSELKQKLYQMGFDVK